MGFTSINHVIRRSIRIRQPIRPRSIRRPPTAIRLRLRRIRRWIPRSRILRRARHACREAEEKAYKEHEEQCKAHMEAEKKAHDDFHAAQKAAYEEEQKKYEEYVAAQQKACEEAAEKE